MKKTTDAPEAVEPDEDDVIIRPKKAPAAVTARKPAECARIAADALEALRSSRPLVMCLTNTVAAGFTADALLALGASPAMVDDAGEATALVSIADAMLVNVGTLTRTQSETMRGAIARANLAGKPWALDPVGVGALPLRTYAAKEFQRRFPGIIRGNASEILALAGIEGAAARGVDSAVSSEDAREAAVRLAAITHSAVVVTGEKDYICAETSPVTVCSNGSPLMTRVAGIGCAQGAFAAAFLAACGKGKRYEAAVATAVVTALAGEKAAAKIAGPGSFRAAFLDVLANMTPAEVARGAKIAIDA